MPTRTKTDWARQTWAEPQDDRHVRCMLLRPEPPSPWVTLALGIGSAVVLLLALDGLVTVLGWVFG